MQADMALLSARRDAGSASEELLRLWGAVVRSTQNRNFLRRTGNNNSEICQSSVETAAVSVIRGSYGSARSLIAAYILWLEDSGR